jgi:hypothetical protein
MGIQKWGAFGGFQKKTGALVGKWVKGQNVISAIPHATEIPPTESQLLVRNKFGTLVKWLGWVSPILRVGFQNAHEEKQSAFNAAFVYNYHHALILTGGIPTIDYAKVMLANGRLSNGYMLTLAVTEDAQLNLSWGAGIANGIGAPTDKLTIAVYNPAKQEFTSIVGGPLRSALSYDMELPGNWSGDTVYPYVFFVSADGKLNSNSLYLGATVVQ